MSAVHLGPLVLNLTPLLTALVVGTLLLNIKTLRRVERWILIAAVASCLLAALPFTDRVQIVLGSIAVGALAAGMVVVFLNVMRTLDRMGKRG